MKTTDDFLDDDAGKETGPGPASTTAFPFDNSYARLPERFYARLEPSPVRAPRLIKLNVALAEDLGLDAALLAGPEGVEMLAGNATPPGSEPLAMAYAGHQFGGWVPQLGDGRAILLGEVIDRGGKRRDIQLKGSGRTPYSRMGDGRAPLGPVLREYIVSEAMAALGVPTSRSLAAVATGEPVAREDMEPGAVLTRIAASHIRVGTFQFFAARRDEDGLKVLADHVIERHHPDAAQADDPYLALLEAVMDAQVQLVARWMGTGFIHGVMNTDNMTVSGETIDYGPCAFMDIFHPDTVYSSIDQYGRYAYSNQPRIAHWNLVCLAQALLPLLKGDEDARIDAAQRVMNTFPDRYQAAWLDVMRRKIGLATTQEDDEALIEDLLSQMAQNKVDFTLLFRHLADAPDEGSGADAARGLFADPAAFDAWAARWRERLGAEKVKGDTRRDGMLAVNPLYIPRNHLVEEAIAAALQEDYTPFEDLVAVLSAPFEAQTGRERYTLPPRPEEVVRATFCGT